MRNSTGYSWNEGKDDKDGCWSALLMFALPLVVVGLAYFL